MSPQGTVYTNPSGLGEGWSDRDAASRAFGEVLQAYFDARGWAVRVVRGEGVAAVEGVDEREVAYHVERVFECFCAHDGDVAATVAALAAQGASR